MGEHSEALTMLDESSRSREIVDRTAIIETRGKRSFTSDNSIHLIAFSSIAVET